MDYRNAYALELSENQIGQTIKLAGWVFNHRNHGGVTFVDLRDESGVVQLVFDSNNESLLNLATGLRQEYVIEVSGIIRKRPEGTENKAMSTGLIEMSVLECDLLNTCDPLPFQIDEHTNVSEEIRLSYRFLDLRRDTMQSNIRLRSRLYKVVRDFLYQESFHEIETPVLTKPTPEGARDYLVPSRVHQGRFFALPQSPQLFKQILVMSGFERYFQIVKCFRDEDLRADRQPEFTQIDIEMAFATEEKVRTLAETMIRSIFDQLKDVQLPAFQTMTYQEAMLDFGSDKPDLRIPQKLHRLDDIFEASALDIFRQAALSPMDMVNAIFVPDSEGVLSRAKIDSLTDMVKKIGAKGLAYMRINDPNNYQEGISSPILKFLDETLLAQLFERLGISEKGVVFFGAGKITKVCHYMGVLRLHLAKMLGLIDQKVWKPLWIVDFPMFERDDNGVLNSLHHPFTRSQGSLDELRANPETVCAHAYDMVINGYEVGGGSLRIHNHEQQMAIFELLGISADQAKEKFGFLLNALKFGAPPHGGIAFGLDRIMMLLVNSDSIRDVIAFPKTQSSACLLTQAPSDIDIAQLQELGIQIKVKPGSKE